MEKLKLGGEFNKSGITNSNYKKGYYYSGVHKGITNNDDFLPRLDARYKSTIQKGIFIIFVHLEFVVDMKTSGASGYHLIIQLRTHVQL